jgi:hypothetical protein
MERLAEAQELLEGVIAPDEGRGGVLMDGTVAAHVTQVSVSLFPSYFSSAISSNRVPSSGLMTGMIS